MSYVCRAHYDALGAAAWEDRDAIRDESADCRECRMLNLAQRVHDQLYETIVPTVQYGRHIALTCRNHPDLRWSTKNIWHIGARSIFATGEECPCPGSDLIVAPDLVPDPQWAYLAGMGKAARS